MCVKNVKKYKKPQKGIGYKWFGLLRREPDGCLIGDWTGVKERPIKTWLNEKQYRREVDGHFEVGISTRTWPYGFVIFKNEPDALDWGAIGTRRYGVVKKVKYKNATHYGKIELGEYNHVIIAKEIYIVGGEV